MKDFTNLVDLLEYFKDEDFCLSYLEQKRWRGTVSCPFCHSLHIYRTNRGFKCGSKTCHKKFSAISQTVYQNTKLPLRIWFAAIWLALSCKKGISSLQLSRQLGITQRAAWHLNHRIRELLREKAPAMLKGKFQVDETYVGGRETNKHLKKRNPELKTTGRSGVKTAVIGLYQEGGIVRTFVVDAATRKVAEAIIETNIEKGSTMVTDAFAMYHRVGKRHTHIVVNHKKGVYVDKDGNTTNGIENVWSILKRGIIGVYHNVSPHHLHRYCDEFTHRYNVRELNDKDRFEISLFHSSQPLTYKELTKIEADDSTTSI